MAKKRKKTSGSVHLSPSNYIKSKARQLAIVDCYINDDWETTRIANITIVRAHKNGNKTIASYLVDLYCMGVKNSDYKFNLNSVEYDDFINFLTEDLPVEKIDYVMAHNIIFAGYEFAMDIGINPCKTFSQTTQYMLEEDNDGVELVDIECDQNGKPLIIKGVQNAWEAEETYHLLCTTIGKENVMFEDINNSEEYFDESDEWPEYDEPEPLEHWIYENPVKERHEDIKKFKNIFTNIDNLSNDDALMLHDIVDRLFYNYHGYETVDLSREFFFCLIDVQVSRENTDDVLGFSRVEHPEWVTLVEEIIEQEDSETTVDLKVLIEQYPGIPILKFFYIQDLEFKSGNEKENQTNIKILLEDYRTLHPDYFPLKLLYDIYLIRDNQESQIISEIIEKELSLYEAFNNREFINPIEFFAITMALHEYYIQKEDVLAIDSLCYSLECEYPEFLEAFTFLPLSNRVFKIHFCKEQYNAN